MTDKVFPRNEIDFTCRFGNSKRTYHFLLFLTELQGSQFRNECHSITTFHHVHECFQTTETISCLINPGFLPLAETHQLIAEAMSFVK